MFVLPASGELTLSGHVHAVLALVKSGAGTLKLTNLTSVLGRTEVDSGTLIMNANWVPEQYRTDEPQGNFLIAAGAAIGGSGTITSTVTLRAGALISPGEFSDTPARLTVGGLTVRDALLHFDLTAAGTDQLIDVTGADKLLLSGVSTISVSGSFAEGVFTLIDYQGIALTDVGQLILSAPASDGLPQMALSYNAINTSIDLVVGNPSLVPEPAAAFVTLLGCCLLTCRRGRQDL